MRALSSRPFCSCDSRRVNLGYLSAGRRYTTRYVRDACIWVALPLTVVKRTCNENGDPDILLLARFHAQPGGAWHGSHDGILPQSALPCQRPNWPGQYRYPFAEGTAVHLPRVP